MKVSVIAAVSENEIIGRDGALPWRLSTDLKRFKVLTMDRHLVMGRKTFESIGRALPGRKIIVLTSTFLSYAPPDEVRLAGSIREAIYLAYSSGERELFIAGGAAVYATTLALAGRAYITHVHAKVKGDARFPKLHPRIWEKVYESEVGISEADEYATTFCIYVRRRMASSQLSA